MNISKVSSCLAFVLSVFGSLAKAGVECGNFNLQPALSSPTTTFNQTLGSVTVNGQKLQYKVTTGYLPIEDDSGNLRACMFFTAYEKESGEQRPITFAFNGGPGSSSAWLHLGAFGPHRLDLGDDGLNLDPKANFIENEATTFDMTDMVYLDPINTGFSRPASGSKPEDFTGVQKDAESVSQFIRSYLSQFGRWKSSVYLMGESYGTTRSGAISRLLQSKYSIGISGMILLSPFLNAIVASTDRGNDLPYILTLPTFAATAHYHGKLSSELEALSVEELYSRVEKFARTEYRDLLDKADDLSPSERADAALKISQLIGLPAKFIESRDFRITMDAFTSGLLSYENLAVSYHDTRHKGFISPNDVRSSNESTPFLAAVSLPFTSMINQYLRNDLGLKTDLEYKILSSPPGGWPIGDNGSWGFGTYLNVLEDLRVALTMNQNLRIIIGVGYYDIGTTPAAAKYSVERLGIPGISKRIKIVKLPAGHLMYLDKKSRTQLRSEFTSFY